MDLQLAPLQVTRPKVQALFQTEMVKKNYQKILQAASLTPVAENLSDAHAQLKALQAFANEMEAKRQEISNPYFKAQKEIKASFDEVMQPVLEQINQLKQGIYTVNQQLQQEQARINAEKLRVQEIQERMGTFINKITSEILVCNSANELVTIQKRIGSEKGRTGFYQEFMDDFRVKCDLLTPLINDRKEIIKKIEHLNKLYQAAMNNEDVETAAEFKQELEQLGGTIEESSIKIQETAFEQAKSETIVAEPIVNTIKGRNYWKWRVDDIRILQKYNPEFVELTPKKAVIDDFLSKNKAEWSKLGTEIKGKGITFYIENKI